MVSTGEGSNVSNMVCLLLIAFFLASYQSRWFSFTSFKTRIPADPIDRIYPVFLSIMRQAFSILNRFIYQGFLRHRTYSMSVVGHVFKARNETYGISPIDIPQTHLMVEESSKIAFFEYPSRIRQDIRNRRLRNDEPRIATKCASGQTHSSLYC